MSETHPASESLAKRPTHAELVDRVIATVGPDYLYVSLKYGGSDIDNSKPTPEDSSSLLLALNSVHGVYIAEPRYEEHADVPDAPALITEIERMGALSACEEIVDSNRNVTAIKKRVRHLGRFSLRRTLLRSAVAGSLCAGLGYVLSSSEQETSCSEMYSPICHIEAFLAAGGITVALGIVGLGFGAVGRKGRMYDDAHKIAKENLSKNVH